MYNLGSIRYVIFFLPHMVLCIYLTISDTHQKRKLDKRQYIEHLLSYAPW